MSKDILTAICVLIAVGAIVGAVYSFGKQHKLQKSLEEERYSRMVAEESSQKSAAKLETIENQLKSAQDKMAKLKGILDQEKTVNEKIKSQYDQLTQTKADLENKLKSALEEKQVQPAAPVPEPQPAAGAP